MIELYLRLVDRVLTPVLLLLSLILLLRGHDLPGGGFIAGLLVAAAFALQLLAVGPAPMRRRYGRHLVRMMAAGLLIAVSSALVGLLLGQGFLRGIWWTLEIGAIKYKIGTPVIFDLGVFLAVIGFATTFLLGLSEPASDLRHSTGSRKGQPK